jgi:mRNA-degrading endonuclease toxin of MazEF toxin-antitoxin module
MNIKRGDIFLASLDPVVGREISITRPLLDREAIRNAIPRQIVRRNVLENVSMIKA